jgi:DNA-binding transcriptional regulator PaaX
MKKQDYSKKIIKILAEKPAVSLKEINNLTLPSPGQERGNYAITRSLKGLREAGLIESHSSGRNDYARLTKEGKKKAHSLKLEGDNAILNLEWDGQWRIILLDLPESRKAERESLRYLLKKAGFICLKNSAWISPYPFEHLFTNIKKDLGFTTEVMIMTTSSLDSETEKVLFKLFGK